MSQNVSSAAVVIGALKVKNVELNVELEEKSISRVITNGDPEGQIFYPTLTLVKDSYIILTVCVGSDQHYLDEMVGLGMRGVQYVIKTAQYVPKFYIYTLHNYFP